ncbi:hypothetical protein EYF80_064677 [Liparis tanakae]|uniref:Uncharacterized protein n=1 Tax=Liparis tanakae TaxID=230148 RepID=A0A4Z2E8V1_9TELE|nr:hypothetical protein EYF80_064677 [Liparis tanakae]
MGHCEGLFVTLYSNVRTILSLNATCYLFTHQEIRVSIPASLHLSFLRYPPSVHPFLSSPPSSGIHRSLLPLLLVSSPLLHQPHAASSSSPSSLGQRRPLLVNGGVTPRGRAASPRRVAEESERKEAAVSEPDAGGPQGPLTLRASGASGPQGPLTLRAPNPQGLRGLRDAY